MDEKEKIERMVNLAKEINIGVSNQKWFEEFWNISGKGEFTEAKLDRYFEKNYEKIEKWKDKTFEFGKYYTQLHPINSINFPSWWNKNSSEIAVANSAYKSLCYMERIYQDEFNNKSEFLNWQKAIKMGDLAKEITDNVWNANWFENFWKTKGKGEFTEAKLNQYLKTNGEKIEYWFGKCKKFAKDFYQLKPANDTGMRPDWWTKEVDTGNLSYICLAKIKDLYEDKYFWNDFLTEQKEIKARLKQKELEDDERERD